MRPYTLSFGQVDGTRLPEVGGKGANLGELTRAGFLVPAGFCVTTAAYREFLRASGHLDALLDSLERVTHEDLDTIRATGGRLREDLEARAIPADVRLAILQAWQELGTEHAYVVRSSATAEDLPSASFAGQQDTFLNVRGEAKLLDAVRRCWASLFSDRAIAYRAKHGFGHRAVVVQRMVVPEASGILFTADPITGRRKTVSIDASFGLGEALVAGLVTPDLQALDRRQHAAGVLAEDGVRATGRGRYAGFRQGTGARPFIYEAGQVIELPAHVLVGQGEELAHGLRADLLQAAGP